MIIEFKNFGALKQAEIELAPLTLLVGANNTSKTYALYAIYGLLHRAKVQGFDVNLLPEVTLEKENIINLKDFFTSNKTQIEESISEEFTASLPDFFSTEEKVFEASTVSIHVDLEATLANTKASRIDQGTHIGDEMLLRFSKKSSSFDVTVIAQGNANQNYIALVVSQFLTHLFLHPWSDSEHLLLPAERGGLNLFHSELSARRASVFHGVVKRNWLKDIPIARYPRPVADYIDLLNDLGVYKRRHSSFRDLAEALQDEVLGGSYALDGDNGISFKPSGIEQPLSFHLSSSTAKIYFGLWFYLEHMAEKGDVLMIDEPELNLHPDNQRRIARILARMVRRGIRVVLSTHSDYLVREFNNLILLAHDFPQRDELRAKFHYSEDEFLDQECVGAYCFSKNTIHKMEISPDEGIIAETFDSVINDLNDSSYELASAWAQARVEQEAAQSQ